MATLTNRKGCRVIQWPATKTTRHTLSLGRIDRKSAEMIRSHVDRLLISRATGQAPPLSTAEWLVAVGPELHAKLADKKLVDPREAKLVTSLAAFLDGYISKRTDAKPRTIINLKQARNSLVKFFGDLRDIASITKGEAIDWQRAAKAGYAGATVSAFTKKARQMFGDALDRKLIGDNPFKAIKAGSQVNAERGRYVPVAHIQAVIEACPDAEWRLIFALARYAGLRTPSETYALKWSNVWWDRGRMLVESPKTEHHEGKASRVVPIFPELLPYLRDAFEISDGTDKVITRHRITNVSTTGAKIVKRSGVTPWPRLFQNLRASCETDLAARFPLHVACEWIGNSELVAARHYLQVTDQHFDQAAGSALQNALHGTPKNLENPLNANAENPEKQGISHNLLPPMGVEPAEESLQKLRNTEKALQHALQVLHSELPRYRARAIRRLESAVAAGRGGRR